MQGGAESFIVMQRSQGWEKKYGGSKRAILLFQQDKPSSEGEFSREGAGGRSGVVSLLLQRLPVPLSLAPSFGA